MRLWEINRNCQKFDTQEVQPVKTDFRHGPLLTEKTACSVPYLKNTYYDIPILWLQTDSEVRHDIRIYQKSNWTRNQDSNKQTILIVPQVITKQILETMLTSLAISDNFTEVRGDRGIHLSIKHGHPWEKNSILCKWENEIICWNSKDQHQPGQNHTGGSNLQHRHCWESLRGDMRTQFPGKSVYVKGCWMH